MKRWKTLIVDDEELARAEVAHQLKKFGADFEIQEASDVSSAKLAFEEFSPDILFLDMQMPGEPGLRLLDDLEHRPCVVVTTAHEEFAIDAFESGVVDYLLKPIQSDRFGEAVRRCLERLETRESASQEILGANDTVLVRDGDRTFLIRLSKIRYFEADGNYTVVAFDNHRCLLSRPLSAIEKRLDPKLFLRANRQYLINLEHVTETKSSSNGPITLVLTCGTRVEVSRRQARTLRESFEL